jgi:hypothetical protein
VVEQLAAETWAAEQQLVGRQGTKQAVQDTKQVASTSGRAVGGRKHGQESSNGAGGQGTEHAVQGTKCGAAGRQAQMQLAGEGKTPTM